MKRTGLNCGYASASVGATMRRLEQQVDQIQVFFDEGQKQTFHGLSLAGGLEA